jgi:hypothetical protein
VKLPVRQFPILWTRQHDVKRVKTPTQARAAQIDKSYALMCKRAMSAPSYIQSSPTVTKLLNRRRR